MYIRQPIRPMFRRRQATLAIDQDCPGTQPAVARIWRARTRRERADEYEPYLREAGIAPLEEKALAVQLFREDRSAETEFIAISYWESFDAMSIFAGDDPSRVRHLPRDEEFLIELPECVQVLRILVNAEG